MNEWTKTIRAYKRNLTKEKRRQEERLRKSQHRLNKCKITKDIILQLLNNEISKLHATVNECKEQIETHKTLLNETKNGSLVFMGKKQS